MLLYLIRHGKPDYETDTLLPEGEEQAKLVAKRLQASGISEIYASPMGRAIGTAKPTAEALCLPIHIEPWAHELDARALTPVPDGKPKTISHMKGEEMVLPAYRRFTSEEAIGTLRAYTETENFADCYREISEGVDNLLARNGYRRDENGLYKALFPNERHVALFCHVGMMRVILSHIFNIPHQFFATSLQSQFTGVTILNFTGETDEHIYPSVISYGDVGHLYTDGKPLVHYFKKQLF